MLKSLAIENFRSFQRFELQQLGRLNLLVGLNNSGKTSILEAIQLLTSQFNLESLREVMTSRGEYLLGDERTGNREIDVRHLFYGHTINLDSKLLIHSNDSFKNDSFKEDGVAASIEYAQKQMNLFAETEEFDDLQELVLVIRWLNQENERIKLPLSSKGGLPLDYLRRFRRDFKNPHAKTQFVTTSSLTTARMIDLFDQVVLTPEEELVTEALRTIEPSIKRIASVSSEKFRYMESRSGFVVLLADGDQRIPIGSMGDGIWRMLGLTLAIVNARNGILLVDEIDTGFHFSALSDMWRLVWETAKRLDVQVFATTHNSDCWTSLAAIANAESPSEAGITIQRIEKDKTHSVVFTERQVAIAAERGIEVR